MAIRYSAVSCVLAMAIVGCSSDPKRSHVAAGSDASSDKGTSGKSSAGTGGKGSADGGGMDTAGMGGKSDSGGSTGVSADTAYPDLRGTGVCADLHTNFPGDNKCLPPPAPDEGMQIHIGPTSYTDAAALNGWIVKPGDENSVCFNFHTPNKEKIYYQNFVLSGRDGTHHIINTMYKTDLKDGVYEACRDGGTGTNPDSIGNLPGASTPYMRRMPIAPENADFGRSVPPNTPSQADMHYFNFGDKDILREFWLNIYFVPASKIKQEANQIRGMGGLGWSFQPIPMSSTPKIYPYSCPITKDGRIMALLGHYHSHGKRFTAWVNRMGGKREKVFEMFDYLDPKTYSYDTITTNPTFADGQAGAVSGLLNVKAGDKLDWECEILNDDQPAGLRYLNQVKTGEMCNLWGESIGPLIDCVIQ